MSQDTIPSESIDTDKAKAQFKARKEMAKKDEEEILAGHKREADRLASGECNWALYNYILSVVDFRDVKGTADGMRKLYECLWPHIRTYDKHLRAMKLACEGQSLSPDDQDILYADAPLAMAEKTLKRVTTAARNRSKANLYDKEGKKYQPNKRIVT